jgi:mannose-1-phosphate guanylyltransferase
MNDQNARRLRAMRSPIENIIMQPTKPDAGPQVLLPLAHINHRAPFATVASFPSEHFIVNEHQFLVEVRRGVKKKTLFPPPDSCGPCMTTN